MYNLFYNDIKKRVATLYIMHLNENPEDDEAYNAFRQLVAEDNITRNSRYTWSNNADLDEMALYQECWDTTNSKADKE